MAKLYKKDNRQKDPDYVAKTFGLLLNIAATVYMLAMLAILPFYNQDGFNHIGTDKSVFFRTWGSRIIGTAAVIAVVYVIVRVVMLIVGKKKFMLRQVLKKITVTEYMAACFGIMVLISHFFSAYREQAKWGAIGWYMGTLTQLILIGSFLLIAFGWKADRRIPLMTLPVSAVVFALGILNKFGIYPIDMKVQAPSFISTIGNVNWYCGYLVVVLFFAIGFYVFENNLKTWMRGMVAAYIALGFAALETQGSDSGIFALSTTFVILFVLSTRDHDKFLRFSTVLFILASCGLIIWVIRRKEIWQVSLNATDRGTELLTNSIFSVIFFLLTLAFLIISILLKKKQKKMGIIHGFSWGIVFLYVAIFISYFIFLCINTAKQGELSDKLGIKDRMMTVMDANWGSSRGATWSAGIRTFSEQDLLHKLVGVGPDCMSAYIYTDGSEELQNAVQKSFGNAILTNAHNEWITILVDEGILGLIAYAGMIITAIVLFLKKRSVNPIVCACGLAVLAYTLNNIFSFQQSMCTPTMFIFLGIGAAWMRLDPDKEKELPN